MKTKVVAFLTAMVLVTVMLAGCGTSTETERLYDDQLTYWVDLNSNITMTASGMGDIPFAKELQDRLSIDIDFLHPPSGQGSGEEKFNIMMAMGELPDIIEYRWATGYLGGPGKAIADGKLLDLSEYLDKMPNFKNYVENVASEEVLKLIKTDEGQIFGVPFVRGDESLQVSAGLIIRQDWLDELGLDVPETLDDWEVMLRAFKDEKGATAPLTMQAWVLNWGLFAGAYGVTQVDSGYIENGTVKYGAVQPGFKSALERLNKWYDEGLLDNDMAALNGQIIETNILTGVSGVMVGSIGSGIGKLTTAARAEGDMTFKLAAAPVPVLNKGDKPQFGHYNLPVPEDFCVITKDSKNIDAALRLLDYGFSEEGHMLYNFGIENESYTMVGGYPTYTEYITENPDGLSMTAAMARYMRSYSTGPFVQDVRYMEQYGALPEQKDALKVWSNTDAYKYAMPYLYIDSENASQLARVQNSIRTYEDEFTVKFIMGVEPIDNFDNFVSEINKRGLSDFLRIKQEAYDRYMQR